MPVEREMTLATSAEVTQSPSIAGPVAVSLVRHQAHRHHDDQSQQSQATAHSKAHPSRGSCFSSSGMMP
jgi:hypothetical protein